MPNTAVENGGRWESGATWTPRTTKLVLIARIGNGSTCYYSIPLPLLQANESRELNIHIHGAGTDDPEELAGTVSCDVSGITAPYEHGATYTDNTCP